jgi:hypothetical protein
VTTKGGPFTYLGNEEGEVSWAKIQDAFQLHSEEDGVPNIWKANNGLPKARRFPWVYSY